MMEKFGHLFSQVICGVLFIALTSVWLPLSFGSIFILGFILLGVVLVSWIAVRKHNRILCERCLLPLQPTQDAEKYNWRLRIAHEFADNPVVLGFYIAYMITVTVLVLSYPNLPNIILWEITQLSFIYLVIANATHHRLAPWCKRCGYNGGQKIKEAPTVRV